MQETWVQSLGWEDPLVAGMAAHSSILAEKVPWTEEPDGLQPVGHTVGHSRSDAVEWQCYTSTPVSQFTPFPLSNHTCVLHLSCR